MTARQTHRRPLRGHLQAEAKLKLRSLVQLHRDVDAARTALA
jgi:hypothetical protein